MGAKPGPRNYSLYALLDPRYSPPAVRYVGCTKQALDTRFSLHISEAVNLVSDRPKDEWIRELLRENLEPTFMLLERVDEDFWEEREAVWIAK